MQGTQISNQSPIRKMKVEKVSISTVLPEDLHRRVKLEAMLNGIQVGDMVEQWIDRYISDEALTLTPADLPNGIYREKTFDKLTKMKGLSIPVSKHHYSLLRLEALRQNVTIRYLIREWIQQNVRDWRVEKANLEEFEEAA